MRRLKVFIHEFWWFGIRQAQASLFAGAMLAAIMVSKFAWHGDYLLPRYDFLFIYAITIQCIFIALKLETIEEAKVIIIFHMVGSLMELFKTHTGSWSYPEFNYIRIAGLPLFSGFMYSTVGSYIARAWRIFKFRFTHFPTRHEMMILSLLVYAISFPIIMASICVTHFFC